MTRLGALVVATLLIGAVGCSGARAGSRAEAASQTLTVFAAASLQRPFTAVGAAFEKKHQGTTVTFNFAGSSDLVTQLQEGASADVFASADTRTMDKATSDSLVQGEPMTFASNTLEIVVPPGNPAGIASFVDLTKPGVTLVVCAPHVPCGSATEKVEVSSGVTLTPVSEENSVIDVLNKVTSGEADAGLVYTTDVTGAGDKVEGVPFSEATDAVNVYPIAVLAGSKNPQLARQFVDLVNGEVGQRTLRDAGFAEP